MTAPPFELSRTVLLAGSVVLTPAAKLFVAFTATLLVDVTVRIPTASNVRTLPAGRAGNWPAANAVIVPLEDVIAPLTEDARSVAFVAAGREMLVPVSSGSGLPDLVSE